MSGHSKWENIKRRKGAEDKKRGQAFSKFARAIAAAIKEGGSASPESNVRLRIILQQARMASMPKENIERALQKGEKQGENLESFVLEGYGPGGVALMIELLSDNRQRTVQEMKNLFQRFGGSLAEPGAVGFQFQKRGVIRTLPLTEEKILGLLDLGITDFEAKEDETIFFLPIELLEQTREKMEKEGINILLADQIMQPKTLIKINEADRGQIESFLEELEEDEDVQRVFTNFQK